MEKVVIFGPGALGCLFAVRLARSGIHVTLVDYHEDRAALLNRQGITVENAPGTITEHVPVTVNPPATCDLVIVLTKAYATASLHMPKEGTILTLQNGLGNAEVLAGMAGASRLLVGTTTEAATWLAPGRVRHAAAGNTLFGAWTICPTDTAYSLLRRARFNIEITEKPGQIVWEKVALSAAINPLTALLRVPNGKLLDKEETRSLMRDLVVEAAKVAATEGYRFSRSMIEEVERVCESTGSNISSMLQDIQHGKRTEIEAITGEILRRAQLATLPTPRTRVIYQLVRSLEPA